jgi:tRNA (guanine37-N1)-methyltransferase
MTPRGQLLHQETVETLATELEECIIICGHYEGIDERIIELFVDYEISIGEYILTGGELAAQVFIESMVRLIPEVL